MRVFGYHKHQKKCKNVIKNLIVCKSYNHITLFKLDAIQYILIRYNKYDRNTSFPALININNNFFIQFSLYIVQNNILFRILSSSCLFFVLNYPLRNLGLTLSNHSNAAKNVLRCSAQLKKAKFAPNRPDSWTKGARNQGYFALIQAKFR